MTDVDVKARFQTGTTGNSSNQILKISDSDIARGVFYVFVLINIMFLSNSITEAIRDERKLWAGGLEFVGAADDGDELGEFVGFGVMLLDVLLGGIAIAGIAGGDVEGNPEVGAGVGGGEGFASRINGGEGLEGLGLQLRLAFLIADEMGADEHQGEEVALHGAFLVDEVAILEDASQYDVVLSV